MFSLLQSRRMRGAAGEPLPEVWKALAGKGVQLRRGQLSLWAAGPGTGKSILALSYALQARVPTLYFSADSDPFTQLTRSVSVLTGWTLADSAKAVLSGELDEAAPMLVGLPIRFNFDASPSLDTIERSVAAYEEVYGDYPALIVVDNVTNVRSGFGEDNGDPFGGLEGLMDYLHTMSRDTEACVIGLHHVTGGFNDADKPVPLSGVKGQISRVPELILTLHKQAGDDFNPDLLCVSVVKNRGGKSDSSGQDFAELEFLGDRMMIRDMKSAGGDPAVPNVPIENESAGEADPWENF